MNDYGRTLAGMRKLVGGAVLVLVALTGCAAGAGGDEGFAKEWKAQYPNGNIETAEQHAKDVCAAFKAGTTYQNELAYIRSTSKATDGDARMLVKVATENYCTEYKDLH